jgi:ABC-2 type transport system ATP-binding protein
VASRRLVVLLAAVLVLAVGITLAAVALAQGSGAGYLSREQFLVVHDGPGHTDRVRLDTTLFLPRDADAGHRVPAVVISHGFGGDKSDSRSDAEALAGRGYAVLTYTARGFGRSGGQIALDSPDYEVADVRQLLDWLAPSRRCCWTGWGTRGWRSWAARTAARSAC